jgi:hypothetical protein
MPSNLIFGLPSNILTRIVLLKQDFIGGSPDLNIFNTIFIGIFLSIGLILISYLLGEKVRQKIFKTDFPGFSYLIDIALGYIIFCTGIGLLGFFSLLTRTILITYLLLITLIALYPFLNVLELTRNLVLSVKNTIPRLKTHKFMLLWLFLFIALAFITLVNPEIREDQYHVDFPRIYLNNQTVMIPPLEQLHVSAAPMLAEMSYLTGIFLWSVESARYVHFTFYLLVLITLLQFSKIKGYGSSIYTPLLFATAPVVIHETSSIYTDFQWVFFLLLSLLILLNRKKLSTKEYLLSGIFLGAMLSTKLWTIIFVPFSIIYLFVEGREFLTQTIKNVIIFCLGIIGISCIWFLRAFILTANPLFPAFTNLTSFGYEKEYYGLFHYLGPNLYLLTPISLINTFSPLFFVGILLLVYKLRDSVRLLKLSIFIYLLITGIGYLLIQYIYGRYLIGIYVIFIFLASLGLYNVCKKIKYAKLLLSIFLLLFFSYYFINQLLILPYSFGIADKNNYLTRILSRDNSSYYNFGDKFDQYISKNDFVATYKIFGYYYADFKFIDVNFIFDKDNKTFSTLRKHGVTKLFIKGGDINWFCRDASISNCESVKYLLLSSYQEFPTYYLYAVK